MQFIKTSLLFLFGKNIIVAIEDINIRNFTNNLTLDLFIITQSKLKI